MALVTTALALVRDYVPYERPPQDQTLWTAIPRGLQTGIINAGVLDAKPINDNQVLTCTMTLPPNFGYVMAECQLTVIQDRAFVWDVNCTVTFTNFLRGAFNNVQGFVGTYRQQFLPHGLFGAEASMSVAQPWPAQPMVGSSSSAPIIVVISADNDNDVAALAGTVMAFISFWQFDLEQIRKYPINSPQPVHSR